MRRTLPSGRRAVVGSLTLAMILAGCAGSSGASPSVSAVATSASPTAAIPSSAGPSSAAPVIRVGLVTDIGGLNDGGFNSLGLKGLTDAETELGIEGDVLESKQDSDYIPNIQKFADEGYDLIITVGFLMTDATAQVAAEYPDVRFAIIDSAFDPPLPNATGILFKEQESGFLTGYLAGQVTTAGLPRGNPEKVVGNVGLVKIPPVDRYLAGFAAGAKYADPEITTLLGYSNTFTDPAKCKEIALQQIEQGADVLFTGTPCGVGVYDAAGENNAWTVWADVDIIEQQGAGTLPQILTSAIKRVDSSVTQAIRSVVDGSFVGGGVVTLGLAESGVGLGSVSSEVPAELVAKTEALIPKIISGEIQIPTTIEE